MNTEPSLNYVGHSTDELRLIVGGMVCPPNLRPDIMDAVLKLIEERRMWLILHAGYDPDHVATLTVAQVNDGFFASQATLNTQYDHRFSAVETAH